MVQRIEEARDVKRMVIGRRHGDGEAHARSRLGHQRNHRRHVVARPFGAVAHGRFVVAAVVLGRAAGVAEEQHVHHAALRDAGDVFVEFRRAVIVVSDPRSRHPPQIVRVQERQVSREVDGLRLGHAWRRTRLRSSGPDANGADGACASAAVPHAKCINLAGQEPNEQADTMPNDAGRRSGDSPGAQASDQLRVLSLRPAQPHHQRAGAGRGMRRQFLPAAARGAVSARLSNAGFRRHRAVRQLAHPDQRCAATRSIWAYRLSCRGCSATATSISAPIAASGSRQDLRGKIVGVPEYQMTAALWIRGILSDEYGVKTSEINWRNGGLAEAWPRRANADHTAAEHRAQDHSAPTRRCRECSPTARSMR